MKYLLILFYFFSIEAFAVNMDGKALICNLITKKYAYGDEDSIGKQHKRVFEFRDGKAFDHSLYIIDDELRIFSDAMRVLGTDSNFLYLQNTSEICVQDLCTSSITNIKINRKSLIAKREVTNISPDIGVEDFSTLEGQCQLAKDGISVRDIIEKEKNLMLDGLKGNRI